MLLASTKCGGALVHEIGFMVHCALGRGCMLLV